MEYIKNTLEKVTKLELTVQQIFQFLKVTNLHPSQDDDIKGFTSRWEEKLHSSTSGLIVCYHKGCWLPKLSNDNTTIHPKRQTWKQFGNKFIPNFTGSTIGSQESVTYQPMTFEDLLQLSFWRELYDIYGEKLVSFIFEKCLLLLPVKDGFFLCFAQRGSYLQKKIDDYETFCSNSGINFLRKPRTREPLSSKLVVSNKSNEFGNPYEINPRPKEFRRHECKRLPSRNSRKRRMSEDDQVDVSGIPPVKIRRLDIQMIDLTEENNADTTTTNSSKSDAPAPTMRWITPNNQILQLLQQERERAKSQKGLAAKPNSTNPNNTPTFICIMEDKYFRKNIDLITKDTFMETPSAIASSSKLAGLRLPPALAASTQRVCITVHRMCETTARKFNLKLKPRKRLRKKKSEAIQSLGTAGQTTSTNFTSRNLPSSSSTRNRGKWTWKAFDYNLPIKTEKILFRKTYLKSWPRDSTMNKVCSSSGLTESVNRLEKALLNYPVYITPQDKGRSDIKEVESTGKLSEFKTIVDKIVRFHRPIKNMNKVIKTCLVFWNAKQQKDAERKRKIKLERREQRMIEKAKRNVLANISTISAAPPPAEILVIDLTQNTPSDTTEFNKSDESPALFIESPPNIPNPLNESGVTLNDSKISIKSQVSASSRQFNRLRENYTPKSILSTISQIVHLSGAIQLLGSGGNRRAFFRFIKKSVFMSGVKSGLHLGQLMALMDPGKCRWLDQVWNFTLKMHLLARVCHWLFSEYVLNIVNIGFYTTNTSNSRNQLVFFLRDTWKSVSDRIKHRYVTTGKLTRSSSGIVSGTMRLLPKRNNHVRPIISLRKELMTQSERISCKLLLDYITATVAPHAIIDPASTRDIWKKYLGEWKARNFPKMYFIRVDIRNAYPSVCVLKLKEILQEVRVEQLVKKTFTILGNPTKNRTRSSLSNNSGNDRKWLASILCRPCIIQGSGEIDRSFRPDILMTKMLRILDSNVIRIGKQHFSFANGLPQGWALSQAMCNIYYGHMEQTHFSQFLSKESELFLRTVDDYFYASPDPRRVAKFFKLMRDGIPDYTCKINSEKSFSNIYVNSCQRITTNEWVPFCGWRFCLTSGHVSRDFTSYADQDVCSTLSYNLKYGTPENFIFNRLGFITTLRLKHILLDPTINCRAQILTSLFEGALMQAFRFYALCRVIFPNLNVMNDPARMDQLVEAISSFGTKLERFVRQHSVHLYDFGTCHAIYKCTGNEPCCIGKSTEPKNVKILKGKTETESSTKSVKEGEPIKDYEVYFLVYHAFCIKLCKHFNIFKDNLLPRVIEKRNKVMHRMARPRYDYLLKVLGKEMPDHFEKIGN